MSYSSEHIQIMDMRFSAHVTVAEFEQWLSQVERFFLKKQHFVLVMQTEIDTEFPEEYRQLMHCNGQCRGGYAKPKYTKSNKPNLSFELSRCHCFISGTCLAFVFLQCGIARYFTTSGGRFTLDWNAVAALYSMGV